ncbi:hypothetical protein EW145_g8193 [Phellinidium pouzarii]|uniref:Uncharacterized protein n=1 Tax=Phellinidium pouzarii TaxID=167371 RepID=A0A4S4K8G6_9AGAM|nr:hypothetical protein EW145_g8193 [Phellinidium pouzarii]
MVTTFDDCVGLLPVDYRDRLRPEFSFLTLLVSKEASVYESLQKLRHHKAVGSWPPQLNGVRVPNFQLTKEFGGNSQQYTQRLTQLTTGYKTEALDTAIMMKSAEHEYLGGQLLTEAYSPPLIAKIKEHYKSTVEPSAKVPTLDRSGAITGFSVNPGSKREYERAIRDVSAFAGRVIYLQREVERKRAEKSAKKSSLKDQADVEMGDVSLSTSSVGDQVRAEIAKLGIVPKGKAESSATGKKSGTGTTSSTKNRQLPKPLGKSSQAAQARKRAHIKATHDKAKARKSDAKGKGKDKAATPAQSGSSSLGKRHKRTDSNATTSGKAKKSQTSK